MHAYFLRVSYQLDEEGRFLPIVYEVAVGPIQHFIGAYDRAEVWVLFGYEYGDMHHDAANVCFLIVQINPLECLFHTPRNPVDVSTFVT